MHLVNEDDWAGKGHDDDPVVEGEWNYGEDLGADRDVKDNHVQPDGEGHRHEQPWVGPRWHLCSARQEAAIHPLRFCVELRFTSRNYLKEGRVLGECVQRVEHLDDDEHRQREGGGGGLALGKVLARLSREIEAMAARHPRVKVGCVTAKKKGDHVGRR